MFGRSFAVIVMRTSAECIAKGIELTRMAKLSPAYASVLLSIAGRWLGLSQEAERQDDFEAIRIALTQAQNTSDPP